MPKVLTAPFCDKVRPPESGRAEYRDAALPGFRFRVTTKGARSFSLLYRSPVDRRQRRLTWPYPAYSLSKARDEAQAAVRAIKRGEAPDAERRKHLPAELPVTVGDLCDHYINRHLKKHVRRWQPARGEIENNVRPHLGKIRLDQIERGHVRQMLAAIEPVYPVAANRALQRCRAVFNWGMGEDLVETNPTLGIRKPAREIPRSRVLSDNEIAAVWKAAEALKYPCREITRILALTGQRRDDVRLMHWSEIDLRMANWSISAERYKGRHAHLVPLTANLVAMLEDMPFRDRQGYVFSSSGGETPTGNFAKPKRALDAASGVTGWTWHDLRRTLRTGLSRLGIRPDVAERVIGHSVGGKLGETYDLYEYRAEKLAALEAWAAHVKRVVSGTAADNVVSLRETGA